MLWPAPWAVEILAVFAIGKEVGQNQTMVKITQAESGRPTLPRLKEVRFQNPRLAALGIEPMTLAELRGRASPKHLAQAQRVDFFMLMAVTGGQGRHTVDFVEWPVGRGTLVFVRPGQVQQWDAGSDFSARIVLIAPSALPHRNGLGLPRELELLALGDRQTCLTLDADSFGLMEAGLMQLRQDFDRFDGRDLDIALIRHQTMTLLLRIAKHQEGRDAGAGSRSAGRQTYRLFLQALEADFPRQHGLEYYARRLGYSASTISRACLAAEGRAAKQVIDRRIALEAQRLLVHSTASVAEIAHRLGFSESTNFVKFFRRTIGVTPSDFRQSALPPAAT